ncbi:hypothetical protein A6U97_12080 [Agrobacterium tumefaciens]|uniref:DUF3486 family protein n=1 Tax=Agrobacterium tumefaciens TaxID=358 RepID=UPI00080F810C|nr:hypothetical protein A6U97_12080 [Agrobacterium tumefaciens]
MGRGRLSGLQLLPEECAHIVAAASAELNKNARPQTEIYRDFVANLEALDKEYRGELQFTIPSFSAFNRHSLKLADATHRMNEVRQIVGSLYESYDPNDSDQLTIIASEAIKTLVFEIYMSKGSGGIDPKGAMSLANALRSAAQAQSVSTERRQKVEAEFAAKAKDAVKTVAKSKGLTEEAADEILNKILGVSG